ncbi:unnamed protein product, partial [Heterosigma akashiwo]
ETVARRPRGPRPGGGRRGAADGVHQRVSRDFHWPGPCCCCGPGAPPWAMGPDPVSQKWVGSGGAACWRGGGGGQR